MFAPEPWAIPTAPSVRSVQLVVTVTHVGDADSGRRRGRNRVRPSRAVWRGLSREIRSGLPGPHQHTSQPVPEDFDFHDTVATGERQAGKPLKLRQVIVGLASWLAWFGIGVYTWWFTDASLVDYAIATVGWLAIFAFAIFGIPLVRVFASNRDTR